MKIVVTDSGLGGLSVVAELEKKISENPISENIEIIFFNALFSSNYGYNSMLELSEKSRVFNNALYSIENNYNPEIILIACNTLSVVYPYTKFAKKTKTEVKGIVESGIELFSKQIINSNNNIILFGTPTTINSDVYKNSLMKKGISEAQIVNQECLNLESEIQNNPRSVETSDLIVKFVSLATKNIRNRKEKTYAGLCCTHYEYSEQLFLTELKKQLSGEIEILNPNNMMLSFLDDGENNIACESNISVQVVSQVEIKKNVIDSLSRIINKKSQKTATALVNYNLVENLFSKD